MRIPTIAILFGLALMAGKLLGQEGILAFLEQEPPKKAEPEVREVKPATIRKALPRLILMAHEEERSGNLDVAIKHYRAYLREHPRDKTARYGLGMAYARLHSYRQSLDTLEPMVVEFPDDFQLLNNVAWLLATTSDVSVRDGVKAVRMAQEALLTRPNNYHIWSTLAEAYYIAGDYDRAVRAANGALELGRRLNAGKSNTDTYIKQVQKSRRAAQAMSILG